MVYALVYGICPKTENHCLQNHFNMYVKIRLTSKLYASYQKSTCIETGYRRKGGMTIAFEDTAGWRRISRIASIKWHSQRDVRAARRSISQCGKRRRRFLFRPRRHRRTDLCPPLPPAICVAVRLPARSFTQNSTFSSTCVTRMTKRMSTFCF